nr:hypothetical protein [Tanacetum cinerariifolium]
DLRSQLAGQIKFNEEQSLANDSLKAELERFKTQVQNLEQSKVKKDLEQLVFERNKQNANLEEQLVSLKQQLLQHVESHTSLKTEYEMLKNAKNALEESYLKELVCLRNTNKVVTKLLQSIKNDILRDETVSIKKRYQDLYKSKAESNSNVSSGAAVPEKPKVFAPGLYAMTPKYVPPQKRNNREVNTPLPRNEKVSSTLTSYKRKDIKIKDTSTGSPPDVETQAVNNPVNVNDLSD